MEAEATQMAIRLRATVIHAFAKVEIGIARIVCVREHAQRMETHTLHRTMEGTLISKALAIMYSQRE